jgi:putative nucleotidyltransferase with HDIG domain
MKLPMTRAEALTLLEAKIQSPSLRKHSLASEAIMQRLAEHFGEDAEAWGVVGLLHDLDLESIDDDMRRHAETTAGWLAELGFPAEVLQAIRAHNGDILGVEPTSRLDLALTAAESMTGLVSACALIYPSKKVADVQVKSLRKRMKESRFAANVDRDRIRKHEALGLDFDQFATLSLEGMGRIAEDLGL